MVNINRYPNYSRINRICIIDIVSLSYFTVLSLSIEFNVLLKKLFFFFSPNLIVYTLSGMLLNQVLAL